MNEARDNSSKGVKRGYLVSGQIIDKARKAGIPLLKLQEMVKLSTRVTHEAGNRRYHDVYFMVEGNKILDITVIKDVDDSGPPSVPTKGTNDAPLVIEPTKQTNYASREIDLPKKRVECTFCNDTKKIRAFDECGYCEGVGCKYCDEGLVPSAIPCPMCVNRSVLSKRIV